MLISKKKKVKSKMVESKKVKGLSVTLKTSKKVETNNYDLFNGGIDLGFRG